MTDKTYSGRTALVTGASAGIGREIAQHLLDQGCHVISAARRPLNIASDYVTSYEVDLADRAAVQAFAKTIAADHAVDILVNNAGVVRNTPVEDVSGEEFDLLQELHLFTAIQLAQAVIPNMKAQGFGRIVNMSSRAVVGMQQRTVYAATKAAIMSMTRTWALELGPSGITVNAIAPGIVMTDMVAPDIPAGGEKARAIAASLPRRRLGKADDIARATLFFTDPRNDWVTGQTLFVCGGASLASTAVI
ncbi:SDR family NAD(P)-dependent oxidoreductase [Sulfitobacter aestuariivivens]|uniref:SDR family oxidoreductase n=1 Tax=Sulfitobacter aestuariivivens TaxID=2766981 RepID=A0A927D556_9RHOB|nr:SDR family oxidoreductase [Sulfitobacter aestuariivivens]MBD3665328.1 SDR family oxidoreductase [Sulfitobacter aestuariivivens]